MEVNIILILLAIHIAGIIFFKPENNTLYCGIFAWSGKSAKSFNKAKFDIQGLQLLDINNIKITVNLL